MYNSDSDLGSDDEDEVKKPNGRPIKPLSKKDRKGESTYIRSEGDNPMDLLSRSIAGRVTSMFFLQFCANELDANPSAASTRRKPGQEAAHFKTDKTTGRLIVEDSEDETSTPADTGNAYLSALTSTDGATRDAKGGLKFNKNTKRGREAEREAEAMELDELVGDKDRIREKLKKKAKKEVVRLGEEFRSKVCSFALDFALITACCWGCQESWRTRSVQLCAYWPGCS